MKTILLTLIICLLTGCSGGNLNMELKSNEQIKVLLYPSSGTPETTGAYHFTLNADGELLVEERIAVEREGLPPFDPPIQWGIDDVRAERKQLTSSEISVIIDLADRIFEGSLGNDIAVDDSWEFQMFYKGEVVKHTHWLEFPQQIQSLIDEIIRLSPIEVDLREFA